MFGRQSLIAPAQLEFGRLSEAFVACPVVLIPVGCCAMADIYRIAYERACELNKPSRWAPLYQTSPN
jgi:hypothetical protein